ncbi:MAG TPA: primosomal protein N' [Thermoanaerobaculia bacterium]|jgi:primosomal protein N' (replication factor Y)|nr:primosomal protein N' [Thermoanaerobaculia bacterium]
MSDLLADVALPLPLPDPLVYAVPANWAALAVPGVRARVPVGKRRLSGMIVAVHGRRPEGVNLRPIVEILDRVPVLTPDLLELARFVADYYLAPLGEVVRSMLPADLPPWGDRKVWLTSAGALAVPRSPDEEAVLEALREGGRMTVAELQSRVGPSDLDGILGALAEGGKVSGEEHRARSSRYVNAVELAPGETATHLASAGRSPAGRGVVEYLAAVGRPATTAEVMAAAEVSAAVVRRLVSRGVLRQFTQVERLSLDRHMLGATEKKAEIVLRPDQEHTLGRLTAVLDRQEFAPLLLQGMTGSGKTEVYLRAAEEALRRGRTAILLVPEIALVPALARAVEQRFGEDLAILHSLLGTGERHQEWERVRRGEARVVLGPRSALFAPLQNVGLIVVDEEQDTSYKQETASPRYNARDVALVRGRDAGAAVLLVSATPSLESRYNAEKGKLEPLKLTARAGQGQLPEGILVDLRQEGLSRRPGEVHFSQRLRAEILQTLAEGDQIILLRNRRGYAPMLLCRACGEDFRCPDCGLPRTYHRRDRRLVCHYCGSMLPAPKVCPTCKEEALEAIGAGTERVEEDFKELFPGVTVDVLDRDTARRPGGLAAVLERFARGEVQVLIGTQMVSKGHHFPRVSLTAVLAADAYLGFPDFRAVERTYNLLVQVAGRAGRGEKPGRVVIQTYHPDHYAIQAALRQDDEGFAREELRFRRVFHYPPYTRLIQLLVRDKSRDRALANISSLTAELTAHPLARGVRFSGPAPAPLERLRGEWRFQLLARSADGRALHQLMEQVLPKNPGYDLMIDVDPQQLL